MEEESGAKSVQPETLTDNHIEENMKSGSINTPEETTNNSNRLSDEEILEDQSIGGTETLPQDTETAKAVQRDEEYLPETHLSTGDDKRHQAVSSNPPTTQEFPSEPCLYCLRALDSESHPKVTKQEEDPHPDSTMPSSGQKVNYQTDPRPHFGVACSSHSTCRPLWGSEGPLWGHRNPDTAEQTDICPHCHLGLTPDTLRWHEAKCLLFEGLGSSKKEN